MPRKKTGTTLFYPEPKMNGFLTTHIRKGKNGSKYRTYITKEQTNELI